MSDPKRKQRREPCIDKDIGERFPNDYLEAIILVVVLAGMTGGVYMMYLLSQVD